MKKIKAIFKGQDGSCGYKTNHEYEIHVEHSMGTTITIHNQSGTGYCEYSSMIAFLNNWDCIRNM